MKKYLITEEVLNTLLRYGDKAPYRRDFFTPIKPMTDEEIIKLRKTTKTQPGDWGSTLPFAHAIEQHHFGSME